MAKLDGARVYDASNQSITTATETAMAQDSEMYDTGGYHDNSTNNSRLTAPVTGYYNITGHIRFAGNATGLRWIGIREGGATYIARQHAQEVEASAVSLSVSADYYLAAAEYVELIVYQSSGGNLDVQTAAEYSSRFAINRIG